MAALAAAGGRGGNRLGCAAQERAAESPLRARQAPDARQHPADQRQGRAARVAGRARRDRRRRQPRSTSAKASASPTARPSPPSPTPPCRPISKPPRPRSPRPAPRSPALEAGGRPAEFTDIENRLERARFDLQQATRSTTRSRASPKNRPPPASKCRPRATRCSRPSSKSPASRSAAARWSPSPTSPPRRPACRTPRPRSPLRAQRAALSVVRAPIAGVVYGLAVQPGAYRRPSARLIANVGRLDRVRVRVYVDEPELGRVAVGQPVTIRWQALPGKEWNGHGRAQALVRPGARLAAGGRGGLHHRKSAAPN